MLTQSEYARRHGVSRQAVYKWKKLGLLVMDGEGINPEKSDRKLSDFGMGGIKENPVIKKKTSVSTGGVNQIDKSVNHRKIAEDIDEEAEDAVDSDDDQELTESLFRLETGHASKKDAERVKENALALKHWTDYQEKIGKLVDRDTVKKEVFNLARIARDSWLNLPTRVGPEIAAALNVDPTKLMVALEKMINDHLEELSVGEPGREGSGGGA